MDRKVSLDSSDELGGTVTGVEERVAAMTLDEKAALCVGLTAWTTSPIERIGLPSLRMADGPHGLRRTLDPTSMARRAYQATCFPTAASMAASWNPELVREIGEAIGREAVALEVHVVLGPGVNIKRSPLCGRNFEYFSEDPFLAGALASEWISGVQSQGVGTSLKHFAANNQETRRMSVSAEIDERAMREIYLAAFEMAVRRSKPWTVMCAYNRVNGTYASEHVGLLTHVLRDEWGFEGCVVSDWAAVHDRIASLTAGLDLEMPGPRPRRSRAIVEAVRSGGLDEALLDRAVMRIVRLAEQSGANTNETRVDLDAHHALARRAAAEGIVLLRNDGVLPLSKTARIAVIGRQAKEPRFQGGGSSQITPPQVDCPLDELARLAPSAILSYTEGYPADDSEQPKMIEEAVKVAQEADVALLFVAMPDYEETEGRDRKDLNLSLHQIQLIRAVSAAQPRNAVVLSSASAVAMRDWIDGTAAVLETWLAGQASGGAVADVLFGEANPSGKLPETFPLRLEDTPSFLDFPGDLESVRYAEGVFVGYRWYETRRMPVLFPFGHGLSYTTFEYGLPSLSSSNIRPDDGLTVSVEVTNTGQRAGSEVVQVYVRDCQACVRRPVKELRGFAKVRLEAEETRTVQISLDARAFQFWHAGLRRWVAEPGEFEILVGSSSSDIRGSATVELTGDPLPTGLSTMSPLEDWLQHPVGRQRAARLLREMSSILRGQLGGEDTVADLGEPTFSYYFLSMPIRDVVEFAISMNGGPLQSPEELDPPDG